MKVLRISSKSSPHSVAGALSSIIKEKGSAELQSVGAGALNQAVKAIAIARGYLAPLGLELICKPAFVDISIDSKEKTAIKFLVEVR